MTSQKDDKPTAVTPIDRAGDRIAKLLARAGIASRREIERMIEDGRIALDGKTIDTPATILRSLAGVTVDGDPVAAPAPARLFLYHKPPGLLVTERDPKERPTIYDRLPRDLPRVVPVGRLDLNTEGLLLLTTDGGFKRQLELPSTGVERTYRARAYGDITQAQLEELSEGIEIEGIRYGSIDANLERRTGANVWIELTLTEGKNREVRRVLEHLGLQVSRLIRVRYGPFILDELPPGGVGEVKQNELVAFRKTLKGGAPDEPIAEAPRPGFRAAPTADRTRRSASPRPADDDRPARPTRPASPPSRGNRRPDERAPRPDRAATPARALYGDRPSREGRPPVGNRADRPARAPTGDRPDRAERPTARGDRNVRNERPERMPFGDRAERPARADRSAGRGDRPVRGDRPERPSFGDRSVRDGRPERGAAAARTDRGGRPSRDDRPDRADRAPRTDRPGRASSGDRPVRSPARSPARSDADQRPTRAPGRPAGGTRPDRGDRPLGRPSGSSSGTPRGASRGPGRGAPPKGRR